MHPSTQMDSISPAVSGNNKPSQSLKWKYYSGLFFLVTVFALFFKGKI